MTNFKNQFASIKHRFHKISVSGVSYSSKKLLVARTIISRILLLSIVFNLALASFAQGTGLAGLKNLNFGVVEPTTPANAPAGPETPLSQPAGPATPTNKSSGNAGSSGATANKSTGLAGLSNIGSNAAAPANTSTGFAGLTNLRTQGEESGITDFSWLDPLVNWLSNNVQNDVSQGLQTFWNTTGYAFFSNLGSVFQEYLKEAVLYAVEPIVKALTAVMVQFAYNPDVSVGKDQFSTDVRWLAGLVQNVSNDLLLLFFILSIWRYWANAAWKGGSMLGAVARILVAAGATTAWPTIYHYVILISNSLTQYLLSNNILDPVVISNAVATAISKIATGDATFSFINSILSSGQLNVVTAAAIPLVLVAQLLLVTAIGVAIFGSIVVFFTMKVIQIIIIIAAFVFGPFFLCLLVSPDTDSVVSGFIRSFIETSLWTFVWTIFLMLFIFGLNVSGGATVTGQLPNTVTQNMANPWFVLFFELGTLQAMIQTPGYLSRGKISEAGEFLEIFALWRIGKGVGNYLFGADGKVSKAFRYAKRNNPLASGKDGPSMSLGGEGFLPTSTDGQNFASLSKLNTFNKTGIAAVVGKGAKLNPAGAAGSRLGGALLGGSAAAAGSTLAGAGGMSTPFGSGNVNPLAQAGRSAMGQFSTSLGGGSPDDSDSEGIPLPLIQKTSLGLRSDPNPWHDTRGRRTSAVDYLAAYNLKSIRPGNVALLENKENPNQNAFDFDDAGTIRKIKHRQGASSTEQGMQNTVAALATLPYSDGKGHVDARASTATNNAVKDANKWDAPLGRRLSWALSGGRVPKYVQNIENDRLEKEKVKARIQGAAAYVRGENGNAYTKFLEWKFDGKMNDDTRSMLAYTSENTGATLGGFNLNLDSGIRRLGNMGLDINPVTMGIASHEGITSMKPSEQPQAIPAALQLVNSYLGGMGIDPKNKKIWNQSNLHWAAADGILQGLSPGHLRAAHAIANTQGINAVNPFNVNKVMDAHRIDGRGESTQAYERTALSYFRPPQQNQAFQGAGRGSRF